MPLVLIFSLIAFQVLLVFVHLAVYATLAAAFGIGSAALQIFFVLLALTFVSASVLVHWFENTLLDWYYTVAAYWFGLIHFLFVGGFAFFFVAAILYSFNYYVPSAIIGGISFGALLLIHLYGTWTSNRAEITRIKVELAGLPADWRGKKIVFVSDLHLGNIWGSRFAAKVAKKIYALQPEIILIGGDVYDGTKCNVVSIIEPLRSLATAASHGAYFITGNHEYLLSNIQVALAAIRGLGIKILNNEKVDIGGLTLVGVDDKTAHRRDDFRNILQDLGIEKNKPTILIKHEPDHLDVAREVGVTLGFFGHTHHGQIFPLNYIMARMYGGFDYGLKRLGDAARGTMQVYTSSGVGTWGPPLRLGTKSEIVVAELQ
jgi:predicted MPP superfamily phosphohydrolase